MSEEKIRRTGIGAILTGLLFLFTFYLGERLGLPESVFFPFALVVLLLLLWTLPGLRAAHAGSEPGVMKIGFWLAIAGLILLAVIFAYGAFIYFVQGVDMDQEEPAWVGVSLGIGFFGTVIGVLLFGIGMIKASVVPRLAAILFTLGLPLGALIDVATGAFFEDNGDSPEIGYYIGPPLFIISLLWLGYWLLNQRESEPTSAD